MVEEYPLGYVTIAALEQLSVDSLGPVVFIITRIYCLNRISLMFVCLFVCS